MLVTNETVVLYPHDRILDRVFVRFLPQVLRPNHVTVFRIFLTPFVLLSVVSERWEIAVPLFLFTAFTDAVDGTMARIRKQITVWGTIMDPVADKLLIGSVALVLIARELSATLAIVMIVIELLIGFTAYLRKRRGVIISANRYGKLKMIFQVLGVMLLLLHRLTMQPELVTGSVVAFLIGIVLATVSLFTYGL